MKKLHEGILKGIWEGGRLLRTTLQSVEIEGKKALAVSMHELNFMFFVAKVIEEYNFRKNPKEDMVAWLKSTESKPIEKNKTMYYWIGYEV